MTKSFDGRGKRAGDPCKTRMRVFRCRGMWRVFELAQPGQAVSRHGDYRFPEWSKAMRYAHECIAADIRTQTMYVFTNGEYFGFTPREKD